MSCRWCKVCNDACTLRKSPSIPSTGFYFHLCLSHAGTSSIENLLNYYPWKMWLVFFFNSEFCMVELKQFFTWHAAKETFTKESLVLPGMLPMQEYLKTFGAHSWSPTTALQCSPGSVNRLGRGVDGRNYHQVLLFVTLKWVLKRWPFQGWKRDLQLGDQTVTWKKRAVDSW